jgi:hypothetical protein
MSDLMMNVLLITLLTPCWMSDQYVRFNYEFVHILKSKHHVVWQMTMPDLMMNVHTCITETTAYHRVYVRSLCHIY